MRNAVATYRIQLHKDFNAEDLERVIPYLKKLGISTLYASPVFEAVPGSTHGYDSVNPHQVNPEIGTVEQLKSISKRLKEHGVSWLQDIVPNHMAYHQNNHWLMDVLEKGPLSQYERIFDLPHTNELYQGRVMVPFLGSALEKVIEQGELKVAYQNKRLVFKYYDSAWPLNIRSYEIILSSGAQDAVESVNQLLTQIHHIHEIDERKAFSIAMDEFRMQLASLANDPKISAWLTTCLQKLNDNKEELMQLAGHQSYRLCHWRETDTNINFRRFFTVNGLICLNIQNEDVFQRFHQLIRSLLKEGVFHGLRIDHIDGLYDPAGYLQQLRELTGDEACIVVEKILEPGEKLPESWPVQGTTGYDFLALVNNVFTDKSSEKRFSRFYKGLAGRNPAVDQQIRNKKSYILYQHMAGELENLFRIFTELNLTDQETIDNIQPHNIRKAIGEFLIHCPVYRYYGNRFPLKYEEAVAIQNILQDIRKDNEQLGAAVGLLETTLLLRPLNEDDEYNDRAVRFYQLCMQFTGPLMAKGVEDTLMYTYNRFIGHNEVGDSPAVFGISADEFHTEMQYRQRKWPLSLNATSTHDTKRGEDVRARLNVLTDLADEWLKTVAAWRKLNEDLKEKALPDANDEYFIYQVLIGAYPMPGQDEDHFPDRIREYLEKGLREGKQHSSWNLPDQEYEKAATTFATALLDKNRPFWASFNSFHQKVSDYGIINSLSQVLLKFTCPGVPDVYQGCELWDLSLVDPDNRRPVNYELRQLWLQEFESASPGNLLNNLWQNRYNGKIKLWLIQALFNLRKQDAELFEKGEYIPLNVKGKYKNHILAFARRYQQTWYVTAIPLHMAVLCEPKGEEILKFNWQNTRIVLPPEAPAEWEHQFLNIQGKQKDGIPAAEIFKRIPVGLLRLRQPENKRGAGILMPVTSLPSSFGIGDFGPEARAFANFLSRSCQKYWQLLPLSPTEEGTGHSPYSSYSSMAGNTLLVSPDLLAADGLLDRSELPQYHLPQKARTDYRGAEQLKKQLFEQAWQNFKNHKNIVLTQEFEAFCRNEAYWLDDFALYLVLKQIHQGKPWNDWPDKYKLRNAEALSEFTGQNQDTLDKVKWLQYLFSRQWQELKSHCNCLGIKLLGDLPFYVSYDSVDVWSNPELFSLDDARQMQAVAGVPPDYFNENGQLWGMPVFRWDKLREQNYDWWIRRIRKNMELYDLLRLDHFRAFSAYWEVPAGNETAINGKWIPGPGAEFFQALERELGDLPFVAEDLGDIDDAVNELRDEFRLPGMKVLQFAFGDDMPASTHSPHNFSLNALVYTGTHDNNTTAGWYQQDITKSIRKQIQQYTGLQVNKKNIHEILIRLAYSSVAKTAIVPVQDVCGLGEDSRMNTPASLKKNWLWRLIPGQLTGSHERRLRDWVKRYNRI